jgi:hypothetical protein
MARGKQEQELFDMLRARGLRKRVARTIAEGANRADGSVPQPVKNALGELRSLVSEVEDRVSGKSSSRSEAAQKAAQTRKRNAAKRSNAAKKGARTRAKAR